MRHDANTHNPTDLLASNSLFASLSSTDRRTLAERAQCKEYRKGETVAHRADAWPFLLLVESGSVNLLRESEEGRTLIVTSLGSGEVFWGLAFFYADAPSIVTIQAREKSRLWLWHRDVLRPFLLDNGQAAWELCLLLVSRMQRASQVLSELAFQPVAGRVAKHLLEHFKDVDSGSLKRDLTLDEMAARAGTTREVVCRALYGFSDRGLIHITRTEFQLTDKAGLTQLAERS